jgi:MFS family permease
MRHRIPRTSVKSLEPYFLPRMLAFGIGMLAVAAVLRRRPWAAIALVVAAALVHVTTALWFAVLVGTALTILTPQFRRVLIACGVIACAVLVASVTAGPLRGTLTAMDATWLQAVASKDSLFATQWPIWAWVANLGFLAVLVWAHRARLRRAETTDEERAVVWGAGVLVALFLVTLPLVAAGVSLAVQFQISRIFWLVELLALVYVIAAICDSRTVKIRGAAVAIALVLFATGRGIYVMLVERPDRPLFAVYLPVSPWEDVFADPGHGWKYGTSVRVSAERDVLIEEVKDSALAIYSREVAGRVVERTQAVGDFSALTADHARTLAGRYELDFLVTEADLPLPLAYRNQQFRIYSLR